LEATLGFTVEQKAQTIVRTDSGFGSDSNIDHALTAHWQVLTKGKGGKRPMAWAAKTSDQNWLPVKGARWLAPAVKPPVYVHPTQCYVLRWTNMRGEFKYSTLLCSIMAWSPEQILACYDDRGSCETEIQADKQGLQLERRRKKQLNAQEALILLTDLAHNLLAWTSHWMFAETPLSSFGPLRLIQDVFTIQGRLTFDTHGRLTEIHLNQLHPYARDVAAGLERLFNRFGNP
jgi:hypothetical protein